MKAIKKRRSPTPRQLQTQIDRQRNKVIDLDLDVATKRAAVDRALADLLEAARVRDAAAVHLDQLVGWLDELV